MDEKIRFRVLGITYNQIQSGAYALILAEDGGRRRIPVVIGSAEAQSIAAVLERVTLPRPLVHDVFHVMIHAFGIKAKEVYIYRFEKGVFYSEITFSDGDREVKIDSRTSDAVAIALRTKTPIYASAEVVEETSFSVGTASVGDEDGTDSRDTELQQVPLERFAVEELDRMLRDSIRKEEYERAAEIKRTIERKRANASNELENK